VLPNAAPQPPLEAGATEERTLERLVSHARCTDGAVRQFQDNQA
jgi:hypothetical protein